MLILKDSNFWKGSNLKKKRNQLPSCPLICKVVFFTKEFMLGGMKQRCVQLFSQIHSSFPPWCLLGMRNIFLLLNYMPLWCLLSRSHINPCEILSFILIGIFFLRFFWCGPLLKSLLNLLQYCFCCLCSGFVAKRHVGSWLPHQGSNPHPLYWKVKSNPWAAEKVPHMGILSNS